jgi:hypothetical protein
MSTRRLRIAMFFLSVCISQCFGQETEPILLKGIVVN